MVSKLFLFMSEILHTSGKKTCNVNVNVPISTKPACDI